MTQTQQTWQRRVPAFGDKSLESDSILHGIDFHPSQRYFFKRKHRTQNKKKKKKVETFTIWCQEMDSEERGSQRQRQRQRAWIAKEWLSFYFKLLICQHSHTPYFNSVFGSSLHGNWYKLSSGRGVCEAVREPKLDHQRLQDTWHAYFYKHIIMHMSLYGFHGYFYFTLCKTVC